jgi:hypothetical protein
MPHTFTRKELFDLVWSAPTRTIAKQLGISDVGLAKVCRRADLLLPPRGYWAKLAAGKRVTKPQMPPRGPGMSDRIALRRDRWSWGPDPVDLSMPDPPVPEYPETLDELAARVRQQIGVVRRTRDFEHGHPRVLRLLEADEQRRARQRESPYWTSDAPVFDTPTEQRRLRLLSSLFRALDKVGVTVSSEEREARTLIAYVGDYPVSFSVNATVPTTRSGAQQKGRNGRLRCQLMELRGGTEAIQSWADTEDQRLETQLADIATAIVVHGERVCRISALHFREWVIKRKAELVEEQRRGEEERRRLERERLERLEKARVARLLSQSRALREAQEIRAYVAAVQESQATLENPLDKSELQDWVGWSLAQANRIDPVLNGSFRPIGRLTLNSCLAANRGRPRRIRGQ